jgi:ferredoxin-type protein NapF
LRQLPRLAALAIAVMLLCAAAEPWPILVPATSPLVAAATWFSTWTVSAFAVPGWVIGLVACWWHRGFCRWLCPTGCCADGASWVGRRCGRRPRRSPRIGQVLAVVVLAGAALGYPVLLWLDPLALLSGAAGVHSGHLNFSPSWGALGLGLVLMMSLLWPHVWCRRLCPLGGLQDVLAATMRRAVGSSSIRGRPWPSASPARSVTGLPRRAFLGGAVGLAWAALLARWNPQRPRPLRPPGAAEDERFPSLCLRCGNCVRACPAGIVQSDTGRHGVGGLLAPLLSFDDDYCWESCNRCTLVCPSGAISPVTLAQKPHTRIGVPQVDMNICLLGDDRECAICRNRCPYDAIRLVFDEAEYTLTPRVDLQRCNGCGACQVACPTQPRKAIEIGRWDSGQKLSG